MQQPEKQKALLAYIEKKYKDTGFEIKETVKDTVKFFTPDQSITLKCKNNGEIIMVSSRMRRGKKNAPSSELRVNQGTAKRPEKDTKTQTGTSRKKEKVTPEHHRKTTDEAGKLEEEKPKRHRRTKAEIEADRRKEQGSVPIIANDDNQKDEEIVANDATPAPFVPGESVELKYGDHPAYTVVSIDRNICRVVTSAGERLGHNIAAADLRKSKKPPRVLE